MQRLVCARSGRGRRPPLASVAIIALPAALRAAPPFDRLAAGGGVPVLPCDGPDCAEGEGLLGDLPTRRAPPGEAGLGEIGCEYDCEGPEEPEYPDHDDEDSRENPADDIDGLIPTGGGSSLAAEIAAAREHCGTYPMRWRVECRSAEPEAAANRLPSGGDSGRIRAEVRKAAVIDNLATTLLRSA